MRTCGRIRERSCCSWAVSLGNGEWTETESLDWHLIEDSLHGGVQKLVRDLNRLWTRRRTLEADGEPAGFEWIDVNNASEKHRLLWRRSPNQP